MGIFDDYLTMQDAIPAGLPRITVTPGGIDEARPEQQPRGIRNNNPGNIEDGPFARSIPGYAGTDGRFAKYDTPEGGQAALDSLLQSYGRRGFNTPAGIVGRFAPASDGNPVGNYARYIAEGVGSNLTDQLDLNNPDVRKTVAQRIVEFENGRRSGAQPTMTDFSAQSRQPAAPSAPAGIFSDYLAPQGQGTAPPVSGPPSGAGGEPQQPAPMGMNTEGLSSRMAREGASPPVATAGEAAKGGFLRSATFNFRDELNGLAAAGGLDPNDPNVVNAMAALVKGAYRKATGDPGADAAYRVQVSQDRAEAQRQQEQQPSASLAGELGGSVASLPFGGAAARGATLGERAVQGARVGAVYGGLSGIGGGEDTAGRVIGGVTGAVTGAAIGAAAPALIEGAVQGGRIAAAPFQSAIQTVRGLRDPEGEAARRVVGAIQADTRTAGGPAGVTPQEFTASRNQGGPAAIMDMGGETTRALARSAANTSPEGRQILNTAVNDRFESQSDRVTGWLNRTFGPSDTGATREALQAEAQRANRPAYARAYGDPQAQSLWDNGFEQIAQAPVVQDAIRGATRTAGNRAAADGFTPVRNPFRFDEQSQRMVLNDPAVTPNLQFWDHVKRNLDDTVTKLQRAGENSAARDAIQLRAALVGRLDQAVPSFQAARAGAARFFGADDALTAGERFLTSPAPIADARRAVGAMSAPERELFRQGFVQSLTQKIESTGDRRSILNAIAQSPRAQQQIDLAMGPQRAREFEAMMRVEGVMDLARGAVQGNSSTARQLAELGLAGGTYGIGTGGDVLNPNPTAMMNAAIVYGALRGKGAIDRNVARRVAEMLTSNDPTVLRRGVAMAARNQNIMSSLRAFDVNVARAGSQQAPAIPAFQAAGIGRADDQQDVPRPPGQ